MPLRPASRAFLRMTIWIGNAEVDLERSTVSSNGQLTELTRIEARVLHVLVARIDEWVPLQIFVQQAWGHDCTPAHAPKINRALTRLRWKLRRLDCEFVIRTARETGISLQLRRPVMQTTDIGTAAGESPTGAMDAQ